MARLTWVALALGAGLGCRPPEHQSEPPFVSREDLAPWPEGLDYAALRATWDTRGRAWIEKNAALEFKDGHWRAAPDSLPREFRGSKAYYVQYATLVGVEMATQCDDLELEEELLELFLFSLGQFETVQHLAAVSPATTTENRFEREVRTQARTLGWLEPRGERGGRFRECELCMSQWFHPAARLLRSIAQRPHSNRSARALRFGEALWPVLVEDHLSRLAPDARPDLWDMETRVTDRQLWMGATAAQALAINHADPERFPLQDSARETLDDLVDRTTQALQRHRHDRFEGGRHLLSFFDGVEAATPSYAHAGQTVSTMPSQPALRGNVGWDVSHYHRIPVILRSLHETRAATGQSFPIEEDLQAAADHIATRVYLGEADPSIPGLKNFADGSDGWYRVDPDRDFGIPPASSCDATNPARPCLTGPALMGWGLIEAHSDALAAMLLDFAELAVEPSSDQRTRLLTFNGEEFALERNGQQAATLVLFVFGAMPQRLPGCVPSADG